jgi:hypothetical protein
MKRIIWLTGLLFVCLAFFSLSIPVMAANPASSQTSGYCSADENPGLHLSEGGVSINQTGLSRNLMTSDQSFIIKISLPLLLIMCGSAVLLSKWLKS